MNTRRLHSGALLLAVVLASATIAFAGANPAPNLRSERLVSTPLRAQFDYIQVLRCNIVNGSDGPAFGRLTILDRFGNDVATSTFLIGPGRVAALDTYTFDFDLRYCRVDIGRHVESDPADYIPGFPPPESLRVQIDDTTPFVGSLQVVDNGITTATAGLRRISPVACNDYNACTVDAFDPVGGVCINQAGLVCSDVESTCSAECVSESETRTFVETGLHGACSGPEDQ